MATAERTQLQLFDRVRLVRSVHGFPKGTRGLVVDVHPADAYTVELFGDIGKTIGVIPATRDDLALSEP